MNRFSIHRLARFARIALRAAPAAGFYRPLRTASVFRGIARHAGVAWGDWSRFLLYMAKLNWFLPVAFIPALGVTATLAEATLALLLLIDAWPSYYRARDCCLAPIICFSHHLRLRNQSALRLLRLRRGNRSLLPGWNVSGSTKIATRAA
jgi:hypothetical protein